jgi:hypothetical protein
MPGDGTKDSFLMAWIAGEEMIVGVATDVPLLSLDSFLIAWMAGDTTAAAGVSTVSLVRVSFTAVGPFKTEDADLSLFTEDDEAAAGGGAGAAVVDEEEDDDVGACRRYLSCDDDLLREEDEEEERRPGDRDLEMDLDDRRWREPDDLCDDRCLLDSSSRECLLLLLYLDRRLSLLLLSSPVLVVRSKRLLLLEVGRLSSSLALFRSFRAKDLELVVDGDA